MDRPLSIASRTAGASAGRAAVPGPGAPEGMSPGREAVASDGHSPHAGGRPWSAGQRRGPGHSRLVSESRLQRKRLELHPFPLFFLACWLENQETKPCPNKLNGIKTFPSCRACVISFRIPIDTLITTGTRIPRADPRPWCMHFVSYPELVRSTCGTLAWLMFLRLAQVFTGTKT